MSSSRRHERRSGSVRTPARSLPKSRIIVASLMRIPREVRGGPRFFFFFGANRAARDALAARATYPEASTSTRSGVASVFQTSATSAAARRHVARMAEHVSGQQNSTMRDCPTQARKPLPPFAPPSPSGKGAVAAAARASTIASCASTRWFLLACFASSSACHRANSSSSSVSVSLGYMPGYSSSRSHGGGPNPWLSKSRMTASQLGQPCLGRLWLQGSGCIRFPWISMAALR